MPNLDNYHINFSLSGYRSMAIKIEDLELEVASLKHELMLLKALNTVLKSKANYK